MALPDYVSADLGNRDLEPQISECGKKLEYPDIVKEVTELLLKLEGGRFTLLEDGFLRSPNKGISGFGRPVSSVDSVKPGDEIVIDSIDEGKVKFHAERDGEKVGAEPVDREMALYIFYKVFRSDIDS